MTWQDELRQLDDELAAGQLSAEEYRGRRDELMSRHFADEAGVRQQGQAATPFPPAFRWESTPMDEGDETMQLTRPVDVDETQVVTPQPVDTDQTQVVHSGSQGHAPQGWGVPDSAPPQASSDLPPIQQPNTGWMVQGPEAFESEKPSRTPLTVAVVTAVVVLLFTGGFGAYLLWGGDGTSQVGQAPATDQQRPEGPAEQPPPALPPQPPLPDFAEIGGDGRPRALPTLTDLQASGALTPQEFDALETAGASDSRLLVSSFEDRPRATLLIARMPSAAEATAARDELAELQRQLGLLQSTPTPDPGLRSFYVADDPAMGPTVRGVYRSGNFLVRMEVVGPQIAPAASRYDIIVGQQLATLPADA